MEIKTTSAEQTQELARELAKRIEPGDIILLFGDLGAGKTTFTGHLVHALEFRDRVQSPTFVIARHYKNGKNSKIKTINHLDLYRIQSDIDIENLDLESLFEEPDSITIVEWPELIQNKLAKKAIKVYFEISGKEERYIYVQD